MDSVLVEEIKQMQGYYGRLLPVLQMAMGLR